MARAMATAAAFLMALAGCGEADDLTAFESRALREIDQCLAHGRDCGTLGPYMPTGADRAMLRSHCLRTGKVSGPILSDGTYRLELSCEVDGMRARYTATADLGLDEELREPVVVYRIRR